MTPLYYSRAWQDMYAYFNGVTSVKYVIVEPFTNAREDSWLGDNSKVSVGTAAEKVEAQNMKRRASFSPFSKAMLRSTMSRFILTTIQGYWQILHWGFCKIPHPSSSYKSSTHKNKLQPIFT